MSWLFGYFGNTDRLEITSPDIPLYQFKNPNLVLFSGGNTKTSFFKSNSPESCWAVVGVGLESENDGYRILNNTTWDSKLNSDQICLSSVNGHFVAIKYYNNEIKFFTDELGLRDIYIVQLQNGFGFSTRIDWIKYFIKPSIDLKEFGSRWLLQNQISRNSIIKNVKRLVCSNATLKGNSISIEPNDWQPNFEMPGNREVFEAVLRQLLKIKDRRILLSLSGGLDSRLLLSYLVNLDFNRWETHTFGDPDHPDSKAASALLKSVGYRNKIINDEIPSKDNLAKLVKAYSVQSIVTNPVSSILNLRYYNRITNESSVIIDGGFGEIWRRAFANRLLFFGKNALSKKDSKAVSAFLRYYRADIFSAETLIEMESGLFNQLNNLFNSLLDANQIGSEKWIDLFSIRSRLTNYYSPEQVRIDQYAVSFMPLVQKDILNLLFGLNESDKRNGKLFKQLIRRNSIQLTKHQLVKGNITHPFNSSSLSARLHSRIKSKLGLSFQSRDQVEFHKSLKEFIGDIVVSADVRNYEYYDRNKIEKMLHDYLTNDDKYNSEIDWFLSFELFRQGIMK